MTTDPAAPAALGQAPQPNIPAKVNFGRGARAGALPSLAPVEPVPPPTTPTPTRAANGAAAAPTTGGGARPARSVTRPRRAVGERGQRRVARRSDSSSANIPERLYRRLQGFHLAQQQPRPSYTTIVLDAIEWCAGQLSQLLAKPAPRTGHLFAGQLPKIQRHSEVQVQLTLRLSDTDREIMDALVDEHGAANRSELVTVALAAYLDHVAPA